MKTKKIIQRNLPINEKYILLSVTHNEDCMCCSNCNKPITNIATIQNEKKEIMFVGLDCAETLTSIVQSENFEMTKYQFKKVLKFLSYAKDGIVKNYNNFNLCATKNDKNVECYVYEVKKYAPNFIIPEPIN